MFYVHFKLIKIDISFLSFKGSYFPTPIYKNPLKNHPFTILPASCSFVPHSHIPVICTELFSELSSPPLPAVGTPDSLLWKGYKAFFKHFKKQVQKALAKHKTNNSTLSRLCIILRRLCYLGAASPVICCCHDARHARGGKQQHDWWHIGHPQDHPHLWGSGS